MWVPWTSAKVTFRRLTLVLAIVVGNYLYIDGGQLVTWDGHNWLFATTVSRKAEMTILFEFRNLLTTVLFVREQYLFHRHKRVLD